MTLPVSTRDSADSKKVVESTIEKYEKKILI